MIYITFRKEMAMLEYLEKNKSSIKKEIFRICKEEDIDFIFTLAKKGTFLFDMIFDYQEELTIDDVDKVVYVYSDRVINKNNDFSFLEGSNVLLFDDSIRTGKHFQHTIDYLKKKIKESCSKNHISTQFVSFCIKQCAPRSDLRIKNLNNTKLYIFDQHDKEYPDYYNFCISESECFQNNMLGSSIDLPIFNFKIENKNDFRELLMDVFNNYEELDIGITHENKMMDLVVFENQYLKECFKDFLLSSMCRLKYQKEDNFWNVSVTAYALTGSINYDILYKWYTLIFKDYFGKMSKDKDARDLCFVKMYRYINFLISYYIGKQFSNILGECNIDVKYNEENTIRQFGSNYNFYINDLYDDYGFRIFSNINEHMNTPIQIFKNIFLEETKSKYDLLKMNEEVFKKIVNQKERSKDHLFKIEDLDYLYTNKRDLKLFNATILAQQERFAISNEIELSKDRKMIYRGFAPGECSMALLPYRANIFYAAIYELYIKANKQYELYKRNYKQFIEKINIYFELEKIYSNKILKKSQFNFLSNYFENISEEYFNENIEAKEYMLEDKSQYLIVVVREAAKLILENTNFDF